MAGGINLYVYNGNDPVTWRDPFGLCPVPMSDCPPGFFTTLGAAMGGVLGSGGGGAVGAGVGGLGGLAIGAPTGPGALVTAAGGGIAGGAAGSMAGALLGAKIGAGIGAAIDLSVMFAKKGDIQQVDQAIRQVLGRKPTDNERGDFRDRIHAEKADEGRGDFSYKELLRLAKDMLGGN